MFACAMIKKRGYWTAFVPSASEAINREFDDQEMKVGDSLAITRKLDDEEYFFWALKEPSYIIKMMATGGPLLANDSCGEQKRRWTEGGVERVGKFRFPCPYDWHYKFPHAVDDHNNLRHAFPFDWPYGSWTHPEYFPRHAGVHSGAKLIPFSSVSSVEPSCMLPLTSV